MTAQPSLFDALPDAWVCQYEIPATWTFTPTVPDEETRTIPARVWITREADRWVASIRPDDWAVLFLGVVDAEPWGLWQPYRHDGVVQTFGSAVEAWTAVCGTSQVGAA